MLLLFSLSSLSLFCSILLLLGTYRTYKVQTSPRQKIFLAGKIPTKPLEGEYKGSVDKVKTSWKGKVFHSKDSSGINAIKENGKLVQKYPFKTSIGKGIQDKQKDVVKIDYNISGNPLWLRPILDEVVQIESETLLGKVHVRILPDVAFTFGYFTLKR